MSALPVVSLEEKIEFLESVVIPSFGVDLEFKTSKERKEWMKLKADKYWEEEKSIELCQQFNIIATLEAAEAKLEALHERLQQQKGKDCFTYNDLLRMNERLNFLFVCFIYFCLTTYIPFLNKKVSNLIISFTDNLLYFDSL